MGIILTTLNMFPNVNPTDILEDTITYIETENSVKNDIDLLEFTNLVKLSESQQKFSRLIMKKLYTKLGEKYQEKIKLIDKELDSTDNELRKNKLKKKKEQVTDKYNSVRKKLERKIVNLDKERVIINKKVKSSIKKIAG